MRSLLALLLSLCLTFGAVAEAEARFVMDGASGQVLCGVGGERIVTLDAEGRPVSGKPCCHCLAAAVGAILTSPPEPNAPVDVQVADVALPERQVAPAVPARATWPRGPPHCPL